MGLTKFPRDVVLELEEACKVTCQIPSLPACDAALSPTLRGILIPERDVREVTVSVRISSGIRTHLPPCHASQQTGIVASLPVTTVTGAEELDQQGNNPLSLRVRAVAFVPQNGGPMSQKEASYAHKIQGNPDFKSQLRKGGPMPSNRCLRVFRI